MTCYRKDEPLPPGLVWVPGMPTFGTEAGCGNECPDCTGAVKAGNITVQFRGLTAAEAQKLKTENPLP